MALLLFETGRERVGKTHKHILNKSTARDSAKAALDQHINFTARSLHYGQSQYKDACGH